MQILGMFNMFGQTQTPWKGSSELPRDQKMSDRSFSGVGRGLCTPYCKMWDLCQGLPAFLPKGA